MTVKLSQLIRQGSRLHPQSFVDVYEWKGGQWGGRVIASNVIGAALEAFYGPRDGIGNNERFFFAGLAAAIGLDPNARVLHPVTQEPHRLWEVLVDLNHRHRWTREAIADWLEGIGS